MIVLLLPHSHENYPSTPAIGQVYSLSVCTESKGNVVVTKVREKEVAFDQI